MASQQRVQLYFAEATDSGCRIFAEWPAELSAGGQPEAWLHGPESPYATTLQARYPLRRRAGATEGPAEAWIDEPCFWTPTAPYVYRWEVRFPPPAAAASGLFGIRRLTARRDFLELDQKRWVLRGAEFQEKLPLSAWHSAPLAALVDQASDALCEQASLTGVLIVVRVVAGADVRSELRRLARWPAVGIVIIENAGNIDPAELRRDAPNTILAQWFSAAAELEPAPWARLIFRDVADPADFARRVAGCGLPIVAVRKLAAGKSGDLASQLEARAACDWLQRDLAAEGVQLAGYLV